MAKKWSFAKKHNLEIVQSNMWTSWKIFPKPECYHGSNPVHMLRSLFPRKTYITDPSQKFPSKISITRFFMDQRQIAASSCNGHFYSRTFWLTAVWTPFQWVLRHSRYVSSCLTVGGPIWRTSAITWTWSPMSGTCSLFPWRSHTRGKSPNPDEGGSNEQYLPSTQRETI
jgi:hypothetical protein